MPSEYATKGTRRSRAPVHGDAARFRLADEVPDDREVARVFHARDHVELDLEPGAVFRLVDLASRADLLQAFFEAQVRDVTEIPLGVVAVRHRELRQHRFAQLEFEPGAHLRHAERVRGPRGWSGRARPSLRGSSRTSRRCRDGAAALRSAFVQAARIEVDVRWAVLALREMDVVRRDERQIERACGVDRDPVQDGLLRGSP